MIDNAVSQDALNEKKGMVKTFSFESLNNDIAGGSSPDISKDLISRPEIGEGATKRSSLPQANKQDEADQKKDVERLKVIASSSNPFISLDEFSTLDRSLLQQPSSTTLDKAPSYLPDRKTYIGSPNCALAKRVNKLGKYFPKAFTVIEYDQDVNGEKLKHAQGGSNGETVNVKERSTMLALPLVTRSSVPTLSTQQDALMAIKPVIAPKCTCGNLSLIPCQGRKEGCICIIV